MICSLSISNFRDEISSLSHSVVSLLSSCYFYWPEETEAAQRECDLARELSQARKNRVWSQGSLIPRQHSTCWVRGSLVEGESSVWHVPEKQGSRDPTGFQGAAP